MYQFQNIQLSPHQIAHAIVALLGHIENLEKKINEDPEGGEYEDILIARSILEELRTAGQAADEANDKEHEDPLTNRP